MQMRRILNRINSRTTNSLLFNNNPEDHGTYNFVNFFQLYNHAVERNKTGEYDSVIKSNELSIAALTPVSDTNSASLHVTISQSLLHSRKIRSPFICQPFFYSQSEGTKIYPRASINLYDYLTQTKKPLSTKNFKSLVATLILGVAALHKNHLVHRDLKPQNILLFPNIKKHHYLKLADLDEVIAVDPYKNHAKNPTDIKGTLEYFAPELLEIFKLDDKHQQKREYLRQDLKAGDCYAIGRILFYMAQRLWPQSAAQTEQELREQSIFKMLLIALANPNPQQRPTINDIINNPFFGEDAKARAQYFATVERQCAEEIFIDGFYFLEARNNDGFFLLANELKIISLLTESTLNKLYYLEHHAHSCSFLEYEIFLNAAKKLIGKIQTTVDSPFPEMKIHQEDLEKLRSAALAEIARYTSPYLKALIRTAIQIAVTQYKEANKSIFCCGFLHGKAGRNRANNLLADTEQAEKSEELFALLHTLLNSPQGGNHKTSLKPMVIKQLQILYRKIHSEGDIAESQKNIYAVYKERLSQLLKPQPSPEPANSQPLRVRFQST